MKTIDPVIWRRDLPAALGGVSSTTIGRWLKEKKLPEPDVDISQRTRGWRLSTLENFGIKLTYPVPQASRPKTA